MMEEDASLGIFSLRKGQVLNLMIFKYLSPRRAVKIYKLSSSVVSFFRKK